MEKELQLYEHIIPMCVIMCDKCKKEDKVDADRSEAILYFHNQGWRSKGKSLSTSMCYCPKCIKKHKHQKSWKKKKQKIK